MTTLLLFGDSQRSPAMRHEVPLAIGDPFMFADIDGRRAVLTNGLDRERIAAALPDAELLDFTARGIRKLAGQGHGRREAQREILVRAVAQLGIGGRLEDLLLVTDDGCETLTRFPYSLTPAH